MITPKVQQPVFVAPLLPPTRPRSPLSPASQLTVMPEVHELQRGVETCWPWVMYSAFDAKVGGRPSAELADRARRALHGCSPLLAAGVLCAHASVVCAFVTSLQGLPWRFACTFVPPLRRAEPYRLPLTRTASCSPPGTCTAGCGTSCRTRQTWRRCWTRRCRWITKR